MQVDSGRFPYRGRSVDITDHTAQASTSDSLTYESWSLIETNRLKVRSDASGIKKHCRRLSFNEHSVFISEHACLDCMYMSNSIDRNHARARVDRPSRAFHTDQ